MKSNKKLLRSVLYIIVVVVMFLGMVKMANDSNKPKEVSYNEFLKSVKAGEVDTVYYSNTDEKMRYTLYTEESKGMTKEELNEYEYPDENWRMTIYPAYEEFRKDLLESDVKLVVKSFESKVDSIIPILIQLAFPVLMLIMLWSMLRQTKTLGSNSESNIIQKSDVKFSDVIGHDEVLEDIKFIVEMLKNPELGKKTGARLPKGVLFSGEPGTGKTLIAKAIAGEAGVPFLYANASSFVEMFVGVGAKRVRELFKTASKNKPCIVFIDEIDAMGVSRSESAGGGEYAQTLNALLQEMDGFSTDKGIIVIGATNREDKLDKALIRAGRFDRRVVINPPRDWKVRTELFNHYLRNKNLDETVDVNTLSKQVVGFTGADIEMVVNEASLIAAMNKKDVISMYDIEEAIDKRVFKGNRSKEEKFKEDKRVVAYHEAGHAVVSFLLGQEIARASIIGTTSGVGGVVFNQESDSVFMTDKEFENKIKVAYGGRASEEIKFDAVTTGASNDITQATTLIMNYIQRYGFDKSFGMLDISVVERYVNTDKVLDKFSEMSRNLYVSTVALLGENYELVEVLANKLLDVETLSGDSIKELLEGVGVNMG